MRSSTSHSKVMLCGVATSDKCGAVQLPWDVGHERVGPNEVASFSKVEPIPWEGLLRQRGSDSPTWRWREAGEELQQKFWQGGNNFFWCTVKKMRKNI